MEAARQADHNADYQHLQEPDLLWTGAILSDHAQKDRQERALRDRDFLLDSTIAMGLYDNEAANTFLEKSMRYTAVSSSLLYNHVVALETKVRRLVSSVTLKLINEARTRRCMSEWRISEHGSWSKAES